MKEKVNVTGVPETMVQTLYASGDFVTTTAPAADAGETAADTSADTSYDESAE